MRTIAVLAIFAVVVAAAYGAAIEAEKPAEVTPIRGQEAAAVPKEDLKGAESAYAVLPYGAPAVLPYGYPSYYRYAYPYAHYPYSYPAYYLRR